ncbi:YheC/YheD family protein [Paenibacillus sinopodophylli]|uniref:YheC/YheD family endospore coat-associated protein n=1 Tax=Paenibacillus sinopodophylli TaxID=1837342 RepID=UPI001486BA97|nr:YheC/YheD family protein [Paenibacillus sinopodophylli]
MQAISFHLGILVASIPLNQENEPLLPEASFYKALCLAGKRLGIDIYVFSAEGLHAHELLGWRWQQNRFALQPVPLPDIVYDRCFFTNAAQQLAARTMLSKLAQIKPFKQLSGKLPAKLGVYESLKEQSLLAKHLPHTVLLDTPEQLLALADRYTSGIIIKPSAGMQGRGILHVTRCPIERNILVKGRNRENLFFTASFSKERVFGDWISRFINRSPYLLQPYLELSGEDEKPFDVRALVQKGENRRWFITGVAVRSGTAGSVTSNLHGGGNAYPALQLLSAKFGKSKAERLLEQIHTISKQTAEQLESHFGRLAELGLDYGIDRSGRLWLLEANTKPGRSSFQRIGDQEAERLSIERPLLYARTLTRRLSPSFVANESANGRLLHASPNNLLRPFNVQEVHR